MIELDANTGVLKVVGDEFLLREAVVASVASNIGMGRELFSGFRSLVGSAEDGASVF
jgi:phosphogluconate dehydratase